MSSFKSISTRLTGTMAAVLLGLCIVSGIAIYAAHKIEQLGRDLYEQSERIAEVQMRLSVDIERAIAEVRAAPSELDLNRLKSSRSRFDTLLDQNKRLLAQGLTGSDAIRSRGAAILDAIAKFEDASKKVFELSASFAQPDAIAILSTRVAPAETALQESLRQFHEASSRDGAAEVATMEATTALVSNVVIGLAIALVSSLSLLSYAIVSRGVVRPIITINKVMMRLADGETTVSIPHTSKSDEIGDMARAVEVFKQNTLNAQRLTAQQESARADRSRRQDAMEHHTKTFATSVSAVMATLATSAEGINRATTTMTEASAGVRRSAANTADGAAKTSQDLSSVAGAVEELTSSFQKISGQVVAAATVSRQAVERAETSESSIRNLSESTGRIGSVVQLINNIAGQTNLLALNATIEAARAGETGKGFAVVAGEVKALAAQTAKATAEISGQIDTVRSATEATIAAMTEIGGMIGKMDEVAAAIAAAVEEQSATTRRIAVNIQDVSGATIQTANAMTHVVATADQAGAATDNVLREAMGIGAETKKLRAEVDQFLAAVRADSDKQQRIEPIGAHGVSATPLVPGQEAGAVPVKEISHMA